MFSDLFKVDLLLRNVDGVTDYLRSRDVDRLRREQSHGCMVSSFCHVLLVGLQADQGREDGRER